MENNDLIFIQDQIGYKFKNVNLLIQAFTRRSYVMEKGGEDNEVLEFIGDRALEIAVVKILIEKYSNFDNEHYLENVPMKKYDYGVRSFNKRTDEKEKLLCKYREDKLTELKKKLVQKKMLAHRIDVLGLSEYLILGKGDIQNKVYKQESVKEDLFEAIVGAVALDTNWDIGEIQEVVQIMLNPEESLSEKDNENFVELIQEWTLEKYGTIPWYYFKPETIMNCYYIFNGISTTPKQDCRFACILKLGDYKTIFKGFGKSKNEARRDVCKLAYEYLEKNNLLFSIRDEIDEPNKDYAINQLEILARRGYFSIPKYSFIEKYDNNGNPIWSCKCEIEDVEKVFTSKASSKKEAKKSAAFKMLLYVLENK